MKKYIILTRTLLKSGLGDFNNKRNQSKRKRKSLFPNLSRKFLYLILLLCFAPLMVSMFTMGKEGYKLLNGIGQEGVIIQLLYMIGTIMVLVFGMAMVITVYYFTSDIENLLSLPLKPAHIVGAKFTVTLLYEYAIVTVLLLPAFIGYGLAGGGSAMYWISTAVAIIFLPIVPLVYGSILSMIIMLVFKKAKNKDFITTISSLLLIAIILGINGFTGNLASMNPEAITELLIKGNNSLIGTVNILFPNLFLLERAAVFGDVLSLIFYIITVIVYLIIFIFIAKLLYFKGVSGVSNTFAKRKAISEVEKDKIIVKNNPTKTYVLKELRLIIRTPVYFLNCVLICLIWPVFFAIPMLGTLFSGEGVGSFNISDLTKQMGLTSSQINAVCILAVFVISTFVSSINFTSGTSISREGKNFFVMKYIPLEYKKQIFAKILSGTVVSIVGSTLYCLIAMVILRIPIFTIVMATVISILAVFVYNYIQIIVDIIRPKLNWENEQSAVKQNFNTLIEMVLCLLVGIIIVVIGAGLYVKFNVPVYVVAGLVAILLFIILAALRGACQQIIKSFIPHINN